MAKKLFHAGLQDSIEDFRPGSHFATTEEPALEVALARFFYDSWGMDDSEFWAQKPTMYECSAEYLDSQLYQGRDLGTPNIRALLVYRKAAVDEARRLEIEAALRRDMWEGTEDLLNLARRDLQRDGFVGYVYENTAEGGTGVCLLDLSIVTIDHKTPISRRRIAETMLRRARPSDISEREWKIATIRATQCLTLPD